MTVSFKAPVESQVVNDAFVSKNADDTKSGQLTLDKASEGTTINSVQKAINDVFDAQGTSENGVNNKTYATNNKITDGDSQKECIEAFDVAVQNNEDNLGNHIAQATAAHAASAVSYDDTTSGNGQTDVQGAIDDNESRVQSIEDSVGAANGICPLDATTKIDISYIPDSILGALIYQGTWDANANTPTITSSTGTQGHYYVVSTAGTTNIDGVSDWEIGDWIVFNGTIWEKIDNSDKVSSVNGQVGAVVLDKTDIGLSNVTNDAQLKRSAADFDTFTEKVTPVEDDIVLIEDSAGGTFDKKKVKLANLLGGGGGGGSFVWELNGDVSPFESIESGISTLDFDDVSDAEMYALLTVPDSYSAGDQILLQGIKYFTDQTLGNVFFRTETQLLQTSQDMTALPLTGHTSSNTEVTLTGAANILRATGDLDLTDGVGEINSSPVNSGDTLLVKFFRDNTNETSSAAGDCKVLKFSASVKFDA